MDLVAKMAVLTWIGSPVVCKCEMVKHFHVWPNGSACLAVIVVCVYILGCQNVSLCETDLTYCSNPLEHEDGPVALGLTDGTSD